MLSCGSTKAKTVAVMSSLAFEVFCCLTYIFSKAAVVFGKISHEDYTWERDYLTRTRKSPTVRIKINFSANAKCQSRARRREKSPAFFDHCTPDDNSALAIWKIPGISCFRIPPILQLPWLTFETISTCTIYNWRRWWPSAKHARGQVSIGICCLL